MSTRAEAEGREAAERTRAAAKVAFERFTRPIPAPDTFTRDEIQRLINTGETLDIPKNAVTEFAVMMLDAVSPLIERQLREQIADEIEAMMAGFRRDAGSPALRPRLDAARIARGDAAV